METDESRVAQWKRAGPITQRSVDRNHALLIEIIKCFFSINVIGSNYSLPEEVGSVAEWSKALV